MKNYQHIFFDLDGTLTESEPGIFASIRYALAFFNIVNESDENLKKMIGPPLRDSFQEFYSFNEQETTIAMEKYRERYTNIGIFENKVYEGIPTVLEKLKESGKLLTLATSKPEVFANRILKYYDLEKYFSFVSAGDLEQKHCEKVEIIQKAIAAHKINNLSEVVMIGDRKFDIIGAKKCDIDSIGVLYGYGSRAELEEHGATFIAAKVEDVCNYLL